jgi:hypothetical protein
MTQIAFSELTKCFYFLPEKGKKIDITEDIQEILKANKANASAEEQGDQDQFWMDIDLSIRGNGKDIFKKLKSKYIITKRR